MEGVAGMLLTYGPLQPKTCTSMDFRARYVTVGKRTGSSALESRIWSV